jgi:hypothetical protein
MVGGMGGGYVGIFLLVLIMTATTTYRKAAYIGLGQRQSLDGRAEKRKGESDVQMHC